MSHHACILFSCDQSIILNLITKVHIFRTTITLNSCLKPWTKLFRTWKYFNFLYIVLCRIMVRPRLSVTASYKWYKMSMILNSYPSVAVFRPTRMVLVCVPAPVMFQTRVPHMFIPGCVLYRLWPCFTRMNLLNIYIVVTVRRQRYKYFWIRIENQLCGSWMLRSHPLVWDKV